MFSGHPEEECVDRSTPCRQLRVRAPVASSEEAGADTGTADTPAAEAARDIGHNNLALAAAGVHRSTATASTGSEPLEAGIAAEIAAAVLEGIAEREGRVAAAVVVVAAVAVEIVVGVQDLIASPVAAAENGSAPAPGVSEQLVAVAHFAGPELVVVVPEVGVVLAAVVAASSSHHRHHPLWRSERRKASCQCCVG